MRRWHVVVEAEGLAVIVEALIASAVIGDPLKLAVARCTQGVGLSLGLGSVRLGGGDEFSALRVVEVGVDHPGDCVHAIASVQPGADEVADLIGGRLSDAPQDDICFVEQAGQSTIGHLERGFRVTGLPILPIDVDGVGDDFVCPERWQAVGLAGCVDPREVGVGVDIPQGIAKGLGVSLELVRTVGLPSVAHPVDHGPDLRVGEYPLQGVPDDRGVVVGYLIEVSGSW